MIPTKIIETTYTLFTTEFVTLLLMEEFYLEVVRKFSSSGVTRIHGDKDGTGRFEDELHTLKDKPVHLQNPAISQRGFQQGFNCIKSFYIKVY